MTTRFPIPNAALDSDVAILGRKGGGKTVTAKGIVEHLLDLKRRVLILDPLGGWAGLRTLADGKRPGYKVAIIGGERGDYPLEVALAVPLANVLAKENVPAIIDLSDITKTQQQKFLLAFLRELRRANREPMTIVLEEADVFAPQKPMGDDSKELHAEIDWIARRGRARGFRLVSICQRPARLSKDVLTQAGVLVAHVLPAPQDRDAVEDWIEGNGDRSKTKEIKDTLAELSPGEAWVWSTVHGARFLRRTTFPMIRTLDTTATPRAGQKAIVQKTLADVDVSAIKAALEKAKAPKSAAVTVTAAKPYAPGLSAKDAARVKADLAKREREIYDAAVMRGIEQANASSKSLFVSFCAAIAKQLRPILDELDRATRETEAARKHIGVASRITKKPTDIKVRIAPPERHRVRPLTPQSINGMPGAASKMLAVLDTNPPVRRTWQQTATLAGIKARGGHFNTGRKYLVESGAVVEEGGLVTVASPSAGASAATYDRDALVEKWRSVLSASAPGILAYLASTASGRASKGELADALNVKPRGGHWNTGVKELRDNGVVTVSGDELILTELFQ